MSRARVRSPEPRQALSSSACGLIAAAAFSLAINLLMLAGPIYMMLVYDRVLASGSVPTLIGLSVLVAGLFAVLGLLTLLRSRLLVRIGNRLSLRLEEKVFKAQLRRSLVQGGSKGTDGNRDLAALREFFSGSTPAVLFDAPWSPVFVLAVYLIHPTLGLIAAAGFAVLLLLGLANELLTRRLLGDAAQSQAGSQRSLTDTLRNAETVAALRMAGGLMARWRHLQHAAQCRQSAAADTAGGFAALSRTLRLMLQSATLGAGAWFVLQQELSPGMIIAASIIMGRGLAPAEQAIGSWRSCVGVRQAWRRLGVLLASHPDAPEPVGLPLARGELTVEQVYAAAPGRAEAHLKAVTLVLPAGETLAVVGPSGAGKSTLARVLVGAWPALRGDVRIDGASLAHWPEDQLGGIVGYLPQDVELFDGTVRENIARFAPEVDDAAVVEAARRAGAHEMILQLQSAYDTPLGEGGRGLSGGQRQRIALARALYGAPRLVVLDEPNASLDRSGEAALMAALANLKQDGATVVIVSHRPNVLAVANKVLVLDDGRVLGFGGKEAVLQDRAESAPGHGTTREGRKVVAMPRKEMEQAG